MDINNGKAFYKRMRTKDLAAGMREMRHREYIWEAFLQTTLLTTKEIQEEIIEPCLAEMEAEDALRKL